MCEMRPRVAAKMSPKFGVYTRGCRRLLTEMGKRSEEQVSADSGGRGQLLQLAM